MQWTHSMPDVEQVKFIVACVIVCKCVNELGMLSEKCAQNVYNGLSMGQYPQGKGTPEKSVDNWYPYSVYCKLYLVSCSAILPDQKS